MNKLVLALQMLLSIPALSFAQKTYVLVHGAFADPHAWDAVKPLLEAKGNKVVVVTLPGHGDDMTPAASITLQTYVDAVSKAVSQQSGKVILVGHSMAGMIVSQVAENIPEKIKAVVYLSAYLPVNGQYLLQLSDMDKGSETGKNFQFAPDYSTAVINKDSVANVLCADCSDNIKQILRDTQKPEPLAPFKNTVTLTAEHFGKVKKYYIHTTEDRAVTYALQQQMVAANGQIVKEYSLPASHLSFLVMPDKLSAILLSIP